MFPHSACAPRGEKAFWVHINRKLRFSTVKNQTPAQEDGEDGFETDAESLCNETNMLCCPLFCRVAFPDHIVFTVTRKIRAVIQCFLLSASYVP